eukprot:tig00000056_g24049.t1
MDGSQPADGAATEIGRLAALQELRVHGNPVVDSWPEPAAPPRAPPRRRLGRSSSQRPGRRPAAPPAGDVRSWSEEDVVAWVRSRGQIAECAAPPRSALPEEKPEPSGNLRREQVRGAFRYTNGVALLALGDGELERMGVPHFGARHRLLAEIAASAAATSPPPRPQPTAPGLGTAKLLATTGPPVGKKQEGACQPA